MDGWMQHSALSNGISSTSPNCASFSICQVSPISLGPWQCPCGAKGMLRCVGTGTRWQAVRKWMCSVLASWPRPKWPSFGKTEWKVLCGGLFAKNAQKQGISVYFFFLDFNLFSFHPYVSYMEMIHPYRGASAARPIATAPSHPVVPTCGAARRSVRSAVRRWASRTPGTGNGGTGEGRKIELLQ